MDRNLSVNRLAWALVGKLIENHAFYGVKVSKVDSGATIVDAGIDATGGYEAGRLVTEICMGGCGKADLTNKRYGDLELPSIFVYTDHPAIATLGSQYAGWQISEGGYFAIGSGPARALALKPKGIYREIKYRDSFEKAVVVLETDRIPPARIVERIAEDCRISSENLTLILTPTASIAGATQVSGRVIETGIHKLRKLGLDPSVILSAWGCAPIPPIHPVFANAMGRANDAILYGGIAYYAVEHDHEERLENIVQNSASRYSKDYGKPFFEIFKKAEFDFYKIDPNLFAPAIIIVNNAKTGHTFKSGEINVDALAKSFC